MESMRRFHLYVHYILARSYPKKIIHFSNNDKNA